MDEKKLQELKDYMDSVKDNAYGQSYLIAILHKAQELFGYLEKEVMTLVAHTLGVPTAQVWGVATFYKFFKLEPQGKHIVSMCMGTACYVKGGDKVLDQLKETLDVGLGETTADGIFTLQEARCIGACGLAPVMMIDDKVYGDLTPKKAVKIINEYRANAKA